MNIRTKNRKEKSMYINEVYDKLADLVKKDLKTSMIPTNICSDINSFSFSDNSPDVIKNNYEFIYGLILHHHFIHFGSLPEGLPKGCKTPYIKQLKNNPGTTCEFLEFDIKLQLIINKFLEKPSELFD